MPTVFPESMADLHACCLETGQDFGCPRYTAFGRTAQEKPLRRRRLSDQREENIADLTRARHQMVNFTRSNRDRDALGERGAREVRPEMTAQATAASCVPGDPSGRPYNILPN